MPAPESPFGFIKNDVSRQLNLSKDLMAEVKKLNGAIEKLRHDDANSPMIQTLEERKSALLRIARDLANNASSTSEYASTVISTVTSGST